jgi:hypothetical protein
MNKVSTPPLSLCSLACLLFPFVVDPAYASVRVVCLSRLLLTEWNHKECVDSLIRKAGYRGSVDSALRAALRVTRYQSSKCSLTHAEYLLLRSVLNHKKN